MVKRDGVGRMRLRVRVRERGRAVRMVAMISDVVSFDSRWAYELMELKVEYKYKYKIS